jgi:hypothetical protein
MMGGTGEGEGGLVRNALSKERWTGYLFLRLGICFVNLTDPCLGFRADKSPGTPALF